MKCEACQIFAGPGYITTKLITYKKHQLCLDCIGAWKLAEKMIDGDVPFEQLLKGLPLSVLEESPPRGG